MWAFYELGGFGGVAEGQADKCHFRLLSLRGLRERHLSVAWARRRHRNLPEGQRQTGGGVGERSIIIVNMYDSAFHMPGIALGILLKLLPHSTIIATQ